MKLVVIVFLSISVLACAGAGATAQPAGAGPGGKPGEGGSMTTSVITAAPVTFKVALADDVRQSLERELAGGSLEVARLVIRNLHPRSAKALKGVRIFIEKPDANLSTPVGDPHYAGNFVLGLEASQTMLLNIAPTLSKLRQAGDLTPKLLAEKKALRITFVPEAWEETPALAKDFALSFESLTVEVPH